MDQVNFLNVEYIILRLNDLFNNIFAWITGTPVETVAAEGPVSNAVTSHVIENPFRNAVECYSALALLDAGALVLSMPHDFLLSGARCVRLNLLSYR